VLLRGGDSGWREDERGKSDPGIVVVVEERRRRAVGSAVRW
jgi:hypothetical protein